MGVVVKEHIIFDRLQRVEEYFLTGGSQVLTFGRPKPVFIV